MMHAIADYGNAGVPAFLQKLWTLVEDESTNELIAWDTCGKSFHVFEQSRFSKEVLPLYFKHNNIASFVRQLNMYGFRKVTNVEHGGLKLEKDDMEFVHPYFQRDEEQLLEHIKRKVATGKADDVKLKSDDVSKVLRDVHSLKGRQENMSSKMDSLERENEALWREVAGLRQKHLKQQKIVNKLIQFLVTLVGNRGLGAGLKRKMPLMINDVSQLESQRPAKMARQYSVEANPTNLQVIPEVQSPGSAQSVQAYVPSGSVKIEEMVDITQPQVYALVDPSATTTTAQQPRIIVVSKAPQEDQVTIPHPTLQDQPKETEVHVTSVDVPTTSQAAHAPPSYSMINMLETQQRLAELNSQSMDSSVEGQAVHIKSEPINNTGSRRGDVASDTTTTIAIPDSSANVQPGSSYMDLSGQLVSVEDSLDSLKDLLAGNIDPSSMFNLRLDSDTLQGLFTPEAPIPPTPEPFLSMSGGDRLEFPESSDHILGNELIQYNPQEDLGSLFDLDIVSPPSTDITEDDMLPMGSSSGLETPSFTMNSPLALRRKSEMNNITTEEVD